MCKSATTWALWHVAPLALTSFDQLCQPPATNKGVQTNISNVMLASLVCLSWCSPSSRQQALQQGTSSSGKGCRVYHGTRQDSSIHLLNRWVGVPLNNQCRWGGMTNMVLLAAQQCPRCPPPLSSNFEHVPSPAPWHCLKAEI
jgi:hypothetical protein